MARQIFVGPVLGTTTLLVRTAGVPNPRKGNTVGKFDRQARLPAMTGPVTTTTDRATTAESGAGWTRDTKSELFLLAVTNMVGEDTFYETGKGRDNRFVQLIHKATAEDPTWTARLVRWLRADANMRSASLVAAAEYVKASGKGGRQVVSSALQRADEPGEMLAYWHATHGRNVPKPVKRGIADAVARLYDERAALKYDGTSHAYRLGDVVELTHPYAPAGTWQADLFRYLIDRWHGRPDPRVTDGLPLVGARLAAEAIPAGQRRAHLQGLEPMERADFLRTVGATWEWLSGWLQGPMDALAWESLIPTMGYMALLRNLRNFDEARVSDDVAQQVAARLADPKQVAKSRQLPLRFLSAYKNAPSLRWAWSLEQAVQHCLRNVPALPGRTLVLVDVSLSMEDPLSARSTLHRWEAAAVFGSALALRAERADLWAYSSQDHGYGGRAGGPQRTARIDVAKAESVLPMVQRFRDCPSFGGGTETFQAVSETYAGHDRVVLLTDEKAHPYGDDPGMVVPAHVPLVTFNLAGYRAAHLDAGPNRVTVGGLSDAGFTMIDLLDKRAQGQWPWET